MAKAFVVVYGVFSYLVFFLTFLYAVGFVGNFVVPKSVDNGATSPVGEAMLVNLLLLGIFALQHSIMARPGFKAAWTRVIPGVIERSTYVLLASLALILLFWQWRPLPDAVWRVDGFAARSILYGLFVLGWTVVLVSTFMIDHFELFGLRQVYLHATGKAATPGGFTTRGFYGYVRHPIMSGFLLAFWATPDMSAGHLLFAFATTTYVLVGIALEERDLVRSQGDTYVRYRKDVPMIFPRILRRGEPVGPIIERRRKA